MTIKINFLMSLTVSLVLLAAVASAQDKVIYVDDDARAPRDGTSWATAYRYLQDALTAAETTSDPVEIHVAQGLYRPDRSSTNPEGTGDRTSSFRLLDGMTIKGGYAGIDAPDPNARDVEVYATVLTGDLADNDVPVEDPWTPLRIYPTRIDNSFCILTADIADSNATLDGIVITRTSFYHPDGEPLPERSGGLYVGRHTRVIVHNCVFAENLTPGIDCFGASELTVMDCTFRDNISPGNGGGMHIRASTAHVIGCTFARNHADDGGGVSNWSHYGYLRVEDCVFHDNATHWEDTGLGTGPYLSGGVGGGLSSRGSGELRRCEFQNNSAAAGGAVNLEADWTISDCIFHDNWSYESGGALLLQGASKEISRCRFARNASRWEGGAVDNWGCHVNFTACVFSGNTAVYGGVISARDVRWCHLRTREWVHRGFRMALDNCTAADNLSGEGPRIWCSGLSSSDDSETNDLTLSNCILDNGGDEIRYRGKVQIGIAHTDLRGAFDAIQDPCDIVFWGPGNIDVDPLFANPGHWDPNSTLDDPNDDFFVEGDYHLKSQAGRWDPNSKSWVQDDVTSPCIDAGDPNRPVAFEPFPNGATVNMGAYGGTAEASKSTSALHGTYGGGTGEPNDPYLIYTAEHLNALGAEPNDYDRHFRLMADIDLGGYSYDRAVIARDLDDATDSWGRYDFDGTPFSGTFDGGGCVISHLTVTGASYVGLFGNVGGAGVIHGLTLEDALVSGGTYVGGLIGGNEGAVSDCRVTCHLQGEGFAPWSVGGLVAFNVGSIDGCRVTGRISPLDRANKVGGLAGGNEGTIADSYAAVDISGGASCWNMAGLVGDNRGPITNCHATGNITAGEQLRFAGGLAGTNQTVTITRCSATGDISGGVGSNRLAGLIGGNPSGGITCSYASGDVSAGDNSWGLGGLAGDNLGTVADCWASGHVSNGHGGWYIGGLIGADWGSLSNSHSTGAVSVGNDTEYWGALIGRGGDNASDCFWDIEASGNTSSAAGTGLTTAEMQRASTFLDAGWDFVGETENGTEDIWWILEGQDYPRLWWELAEDDSLP